MSERNALLTFADAIRCYESALQRIQGPFNPVTIAVRVLEGALLKAYQEEAAAPTCPACHGTGLLIEREA